jgi:predicted Fe-Mo cluster-binding NifX family protein
LDKTIIAITTKGYDGLDDNVSNIFGKTKTFTLANVENGKVQNVRIIDNPAAAYNHGSGPIAAKTLAELKVDLLITSQLGPGASELLQHHKITTLLVEPNSKVSEAVKKALSQSYKQPKKRKQPISLKNTAKTNHTPRD